MAGRARRRPPTGIDLDRFTPDGPRETLDGLQRPVTLAVGALEPLKGMDTLVRAVALRPGGSLVILGRGPQHDELQALGGSLLGPERFLLASASAADMPRWYRAADVFASASASEAFALTFLEALACGVPIVTLGDPIRREQLSVHATLLPVPAGPGDFARGIGDALAGGDEGRAGRVAFARERYSLDAMADAYDSLFKSLL